MPSVRTQVSDRWNPQPVGRIYQSRLVKKATGELGKTLQKKQGYHLVVIKSTVIPGSTNNTVKLALEQASGKIVGPSLGLCANPEFLKEGTAINGAGCCIIMTEWDEVKKLRPKDFKAYMRTANLVDARRIHKPNDFDEMTYVGVGLGNTRSSSQEAETQLSSY
jgi:UDP-glucose 6-dehydrogenase